MKNIKEIKAGVAGLGLIGGSLAMALCKAGATVNGFDIDPLTVRKALECGAIQTGAVDPACLFDSDYLFIALYPEDILTFIEQNAHRIKKGTVVIDCCGIKEWVTSRVAPVANHYGFIFIGGHPMAGTEKNGFDAAVTSLFNNASFILTPPENTPENILADASALLKSAGFGRVVVTTPRHHDRMIAFTSQLPHVLACSYVKSPCCPVHSGYSAGSYRDVSRVAHINPPLWAELFIDNQDALCTEIDELIKNMSEIRQAVAAGDVKKLTALLLQARQIKDGVDFNE